MGRSGLAFLLMDLHNVLVAEELVAVGALAGEAARAPDAGIVDPLGNIPADRQAPDCAGEVAISLIWAAAEN